MKNVHKLPDGTFRAHVQVKYHREYLRFKNRSEAQKWVKSRKEFLKKVPEEAQVFKNLKDLVDKYVQTLTEAQKKENRPHQNFWIGFMGDCKVENLRRILFEEGKQLLKKEGYSVSTINSRICFIKQVIKYAYERWECINEDVTRHLKMRSIKEFRDRILSKDEKKRLFEAAREIKGDLVEDAITIAFDTGMRVSEIVQLEVRNCDFKEDLIKVENTKSKETRYTYMSGRVKEILLKRSERHSRYIFQNAIKEKPISTEHLHLMFRKVVEAAKIEDFVFHDIRHNAATFFAQNGMPLANLMSMLGHKNLNITKRYVHCQNKVTKNQYFEALKGK